MFNLFTITFGVAVYIAASALAPHMNAGAVWPDVAVIFTVYAAANRDLFGALVTAFVVGGVAGVGLGEARGVELLALLAVIGGTRWARRRLPIARGAPFVAWISVAVVVADLCFVSLGALIMPSLSLAPALLSATPATALVTSLAAVPIVAALSRLEGALRARQERSTLFR